MRLKSIIGTQVNHAHASLQNLRNSGGTGTMRKATKHSFNILINQGPHAESLTLQRDPATQTRMMIR
jgi:hypothetical protein